MHLLCLCLLNLTNFNGKCGREFLIICYKWVSRCIMVDNLGPVYFFKFTKKAIHFISCE